MTESKAVEKAASQVPALAGTPALEIGADDVALPRLYIGQHLSDPVSDGLVNVGSIFTALGQDDPEPQVLSDCENRDEGATDPVLFHILAMRRGKSVSVDGELELYAYDDPEAPPEAWVTYNYVIALPEVDPELPFKLLMTRSATRAAKNINLVLTKNAARGPAWVNAFTMTTAFRENTKGKWYVPQIRVVEAEEANVKIAEKLASMISDNAADVAATGDEPAI